MTSRELERHHRALPGIERVRRLTVVGYSNSARSGDFIATTLAKAKRVAGVTELRVGIQLKDAGLAALGSATTLPAVTFTSAISRSRTG